MTLQDLTFNKEGSLYVSEFEATGPFNVKLSRNMEPNTYQQIALFQSMTGEQFVNVPLPAPWAFQKEIEFEVSNVPAGMHIRIESGADVTLAKIAYQS